MLRTLRLVAVLLFLTLSLAWPVLADADLGTTAPNDACSWYQRICTKEDRDVFLAKRDGIIMCVDREPKVKKIELRWEIDILSSNTLPMDKVGAWWCAKLAGCEMYANVLATVFVSVPNGTHLLIGGLTKPEDMGTGGTFKDGRLAGLVFVRRYQVESIMMVAVSAPRETPPKP